MLTSNICPPARISSIYDPIFISNLRGWFKRALVLIAYGWPFYRWFLGMEMPKITNSHALIGKNIYKWNWLAINHVIAHNHHFDITLNFCNWFWFTHKPVGQMSPFLLHNAEKLLMEVKKSVWKIITTLEG